MHDHRREETAREFLARRRCERRKAARVWLCRIMADYRPSAFMIDPRDGKPFLKPTAERSEPRPA